MKYLPLLLLLAAIPAGLRAQACYDWEYAYPFPTGNYLNGVSATDADHTWAVGEEATIIHTADGGAHWAVQCPPVSASAILEDVSFADNSTGWVVGRPSNVSLILYTADGGANWTVQPDPANKPLYAVQALSASVAYAAGGTGTILKTVNGGATWTAQTSGSTQTFYAVHFIHPDTGWVTGSLGAVLKTTDGGVTWVSQNTGSTATYNTAFFLNSLEGWVAGSDGTIRKTTDGGTNWTQTVDLGANGADDMYFESPSVGYIAYNQNIRRTTNGGTSWTTVGTSGAGSLQSLAYGTATVAWAVGGAGAIMKTVNGGTSWTNQGNTQSNELLECDFFDENRGWAVGVSGILLYTTNAGQTWTVGNSGTTQSLTGVHFANANEGWICGTGSTIRHTADGGLTWTAQTSPYTGALNAVYFQSPTTGWIVGNAGTILKTVNGGATWTAQTSGTTQTLLNMHFINADTGFVCGTGGVLLKTTDGGTTWSTIATGTTQSFYSLFFLNNNLGWLGQGVGSNAIRKTTDGGATWTQISLGASGTDVSVRQVWFGNANEGWLIFGSTVRATTNGGATWVNEIIPGGFQFSDFEVAGQTAWIAGRSNPGTSLWKRAEPLLFASANDACAAAALLSVNPDLNCGAPRSATTAGSTASNPALPGCSGTADDDVWFAFTATAATHRLQLAGGAEPLVLQVFSGACANLTPMACYDPGSGSFFYDVYNLNPGTTYYLRVYTRNNLAFSNFTICVGTPQLLSNDVGVEALLDPDKTTPFAPGARAVKAVVKNIGLNPVLAFSLQWSIGNTPKTPYNWSGLLAPGQRDTVIIGTHNFGIGVDHDLTVYTQLPNGLPDNNPANDTLRVNDLYAALSGAYTLGGVLPNFPSFTAAAAALNNGGVLGPVAINVRNGTYTETFTLTNIKGSSLAQTVTFQSESADSSLVTLTHGNPAGGAVVRLDNADNLVFKKMTFVAPNADFFYLANGVNNVQFLNNRFKEVSNTADTYIEGAASSAKDSDIEVRNNRFEGGLNAVKLSGFSTAALENGTLIENNVILDNRDAAIELYAQNAPLVRNNTILAAATGGGIECSYCDSALLIANNRVNAGQNNRAVYLYNCDGAATAFGLVANNFITASGTAFVAGISSQGGSYQKIDHNSVNIVNTNSASTAIELSGGGNNKYLRNNVFANPGGGLAYYVNNSAPIQASDFNDLYTAGPYLAQWVGVNQADLPALRTASGRETNSVSANPLFYSATDLHVLQVALDSAATPLPEVATDIDGQPRQASFPDIGADEFDYRAADLGITALLQPRDSCELGAAAAVEVVLQNFGGLPQSGFDVAYKRGYGTPVVENVGARTVQPGDTIHYTFTQTTNLSAYKAHMFTLYTALAGDLYAPNDTLVTNVTNSQTPTPATNMLPADGAAGVNPPVGLSWLPAAGATRYDVYLWKADQPKPDTPALQDLAQISCLVQNPAFVYGAAYKWQVVSKNNYCSAAGPIQQFTLRELPDLSASNVQAPAQPFSGTMISVSWTTTNTGSGATGMTPWFDYVYLSTDAVYQPGADTYLGGVSNLTALNPGQGYTQMANVPLPQGLQGNYYLIVLADNGSKVDESNENNNTAAALPIVINLTPPPDLKVTSIAAPTNAFSGQTINISFTVKNQGSGDVPPGNTFRDYVYLSPTPVLNLNTAIYLTNYSATPLLAGASETRNVSAALPLSIFGDYYIHVFTDRNNQAYEFAFEDNNVSVSDTLSIFLTPPPDLVISQVQAPALVSNKQTVLLQWTAENQGATAAAGPWTDRVYISKSTTFHPDSVTTLGLYTNPGNLAAGASAIRTVNETIPGNIAGPYYFYVAADAGNVVFEYDQENNNTTRAAGATEVLNADLVVSAVTIPPTANSGAPLPVEWTVTNEGAGSLLGGIRTDRIYLSQNPQLSIATSTLLGSLTYSGALLSGQSVAKQTTVTLPNAVSGIFFVHVLADATNAVFEDQSENNNTGTDTTLIALSPWPDLTPTGVGVLPDTLLAGQPLPFGYTVQNTGPGPVPGGSAWVDRVYLSANPVFDGTATLLHPINLLQPLAANASYTQNTTLNIPLLSTAGSYYFYVVTEGDNQVYEHTGENNNVYQSSPVFIALPAPVDFEVMEDELTSLPDTLWSGQQVTVGWCIENLGSSTAKFNFQIWYDGVYLSADSIWDEYDDIFVKDFTKNGPVDSLQEYNNTQSFAIPNGLSGDFYCFLVADHNERTNDEVIANNIGLLRPASFPTGPAKPVHIKLSPSPDLEAATFLAPPNGTSGQPVPVVWTVKNNGPGTASGSWTDKVYLSGDFAIDGGDAIVGAQSQNRVLAPGQQYNDTLDVFLPVSASGNYVLIFKTDANNVVFEPAENNNTFFTYLTVTQPAPSDLVVTDVSFAPSAVVGAPFSVSWTLKNQGANPASGVLRELVYFSADSLFDPSDIPLSPALQRTINLAPNAGVPASGTANTPGLPLGDYFIIAATDVLDNILESDESNNRLISSTKVTVTVPELPIGTPTPDTLRNNTPLYYRIEVPGALAGETLLLGLDGQTGGSANELYLSHHAVPTRSAHDFAFDSPNQADQVILVPALDSGTYYLLAYGATDLPAAAGKQNIVLKAEIVNFQLLGVQAAEGGNTGNVTVRVEGAKFSPDMTLKLTHATLGTRAATRVTYVNSTLVFATFNLAGATPGVYDVVAEKPAETATLPGGFSVVAGDAGTTSSGDGSSGFFCSIVNIGTDPALSKNILHPPAVRINRLVPITIQYGNAGNVDIPAPARFLLSLRGAPLAFSPDDLEAKQEELYIAFQEVGGPPGILRPGAFSSITVYSWSSQPLLFVLRE